MCAVIFSNTLHLFEAAGSNKLANRPVFKQCSLHYLLNTIATYHIHITNANTTLNIAIN